jgi:hypothetical protein
LITKNGTAPFADQKRDSPNLPTGLSYSESNVVHSKQGLAGTRGTDLPGENHVSPRLVDVEKIWSNTALEESATNKVNQRQLETKDN